MNMQNAERIFWIAIYTQGLLCFVWAIRLAQDETFYFLWILAFLAGGYFVSTAIKELFGSPPRVWGQREK